MFVALSYKRMNRLRAEKVEAARELGYASASRRNTPPRSPVFRAALPGCPRLPRGPVPITSACSSSKIVNTYAANDIVQFGDGSRLQDTTGEIPHHLEIDCCYIHGDPDAMGQKRGVSLNSASTTIVNSYISNIKSKQEDSQAIAGWNGPGPYTIENNYLEAAGEVFLLGGADPKIPTWCPRTCRSATTA